MLGLIQSNDKLDQSALATLGPSYQSNGICGLDNEVNALKDPPSIGVLEPNILQLDNFLHFEVFQFERVPPLF